MSATDTAKETMLGWARRGSIPANRIDPRVQSADVVAPVEKSTTSPAATSELPPPGPSNIIVLGANPLPAPRSVESQ
jgi:hypothetical protein